MFINSINNKYTCEDCNKQTSTTVTCEYCGKEICFDCAYTTPTGTQCPTCFDLLNIAIKLGYSQQALAAKTKAELNEIIDNHYKTISQTNQANDSLS